MKRQFYAEYCSSQLVKADLKVLFCRKACRTARHELRLRGRSTLPRMEKEFGVRSRGLGSLSRQ